MRTGTGLRPRASVCPRSGDKPLQAMGAVARHLAEAAFWVLTKRELYREPGSSTKRKRGVSLSPARLVKLIATRSRDIFMPVVRA